MLEKSMKTLDEILNNIHEIIDEQKLDEISDFIRSDELLDYTTSKENALKMLQFLRPLRSNIGRYSILAQKENKKLPSIGFILRDLNKVKTSMSRTLKNLQNLDDISGALLDHFHTFDGGGYRVSEVFDTENSKEIEPRKLFQYFLQDTINRLDHLDRYKLKLMETPNELLENPKGGRPEKQAKSKLIQLIAFQYDKYCDNYTKSEIRSFIIEIIEYFFEDFPEFNNKDTLSNDIYTELKLCNLNYIET